MLRQAGDAAMIQVNPIDAFIVIAPAAEPGQALDAERLFFIACGMQGELEAVIEHKVNDHLVIRIIKYHFDDLSYDDRIDWRVWLGCQI